MFHVTLWTLASAFLFQAAAILAKVLGAALPPAEVGLFRALGGVLIVVLAWHELRGIRRLPDPLGHLVRGLLGALTIGCLMHAYATLPLALATAIYYARALLMIPLARVALSERSGPDLWLAAVIGLAGVVITLAPSVERPELWTGIAAILTATIASAGSQVAAARLTRTNPPGLIVAVFAVVTVAVMSGWLSLPGTAWISPSASDALLLAGLGAAGAAAQYAIARAYALAGASRVAPLAYVEIPMAVAGGLILAHEMPSTSQIIGTVIVVASALYVTGLPDGLRGAVLPLRHRCPATSPPAAPQPGDPLAHLSGTRRP